MAFWRRNKSIPREEQQASIMLTAPTCRPLRGIEAIRHLDAPQETQPSQEYRGPISFHEYTGPLHDRIQRSASFRTWMKIDSYCADNADKEIWIGLKQLNRERQERFQETLRSIKPIFAREAVRRTLSITRRRDSSIHIDNDLQEKGLETRKRNSSFEMDEIDREEESDTQCSSIRSNSPSVV